MLPTERELEALKVLWQRDEATVREIFAELSQRYDLAYTTVLSLVQTMERKGFVQRETQGRGKTSTYKAVLKAEPTLRELAGDFLDKVFDGAVGQYLVRALESQNPSADELDELEQMIAEARRRQAKDRPSDDSGGQHD